MGSQELREARAPAEQVGRVTRVGGVGWRYVEFLKGTFRARERLDGLKIVIDCANGAAYKFAPVVLEELGADVISIGVDPNGRNINDHCGALYPQALQETVLQEKAQLGIALDGDADRVIMVDECGEVIDGDAIMALIACRQIEDQQLRQNTVVATVMEQSWAGANPLCPRRQTRADSRW